MCASPFPFNHYHLFKKSFNLFKRSPLFSQKSVVTETIIKEKNRCTARMVLFTFKELFDLVLMTVVLGYIFLPSIQRPRAITEMFNTRALNWQDFRFAILVTAPAVVLHELMHKFAALFLGLAATFHASYFGLGLGILLRLVQSPFIVFVPGYVSISAAPPLASAFTAFMGPLTNLLLFCIATLMLKHAKKLKRNHALMLALTKQINLFLFLFNMIPIPPFDGFHVANGLFQTFF